MAVDVRRFYEVLLYSVSRIREGQDPSGHVDDGA